MPKIDVKPGFTGARHPELFKSKTRGRHRKPGQLTDEQFQHYWDHGYVVVSGLFETELLTQCCIDIDKQVDELAHKLFEYGKVQSLYENYGLRDRLIKLEKDFPGANIILHRLGKMPQSFHEVAQHPKMLNLIEDLIGPDIAFNPVWNLRTKTPNNAPSTVPWHQDCAYMDHECYDVHVPTAWIPLVDATKERGTLSFVKDSHKEGFVANHVCCAGPTWYVELDEDEIKKSFGSDMEKDVEIVEVPFGSFILFNNFTIHRSLNNFSDMVRWSLDFRWQPANRPSCLWGLKDTVVLRKKDDPDFKPDWSTFDSVDRNKEQNKSLDRESTDLCTVISGPWMKKWKIVHHNTHTDAFEADETNFDPNMIHG